MTDFPTVCIQVGPVSTFHGAQGEQYLEATNEFRDVSGLTEPNSVHLYASYLGFDAQSDGKPTDMETRYMAVGPPEDPMHLVAVPTAAAFDANRRPAWVTIAAKGAGTSVAGLKQLCLVLVDVMGVLGFCMAKESNDSAQESTYASMTAVHTLLRVMQYVKWHFDDLGLMLHAWREGNFAPLAPPPLSASSSRSKWPKERIATFVAFGTHSRIALGNGNPFLASTIHALRLVVAAFGEPLRWATVVNACVVHTVLRNDFEERVQRAEETLSFLGVNRRNCFAPTATEAVRTYTAFAAALDTGASDELREARQWHQTVALEVCAALKVLQDVGQRTDRHSVRPAEPENVIEVPIFPYDKSDRGMLQVRTVPVPHEADDGGGPSHLVIAAFQCPAEDCLDDDSSWKDQLPKFIDSASEAHDYIEEFMLSVDSHRWNVSWTDKGLVGLPLSMSSEKEKNPYGTPLGNGAIAFAIVDRTRDGSNPFDQEGSKITLWSLAAQQPPPAASAEEDLGIGPRHDFTQATFAAYFKRCVWRAIELLGNGVMEGSFGQDVLSFHFGRFLVIGDELKKAVQVIAERKAKPQSTAPMPQLQVQPWQAPDDFSAVRPHCFAVNPKKESAPSTLRRLIEVYVLTVADDSAAGATAAAEHCAAQLVRQYVVRSCP